MSLTHEQIVYQLLDFYYDETAEWWHQSRLSRPEAYKYHDKLITSGNIITVLDQDVLCGYVEYWRLSYEQFGRIICHEPFSALHENVSTGQIAYLANTYIRPEYRDSSVAKQLRDRFFEINEPCTHFCGTALRKRTQPIKVFRKEDIMRFNRKEAEV